MAGLGTWALSDVLSDGRAERSREATARVMKIDDAGIAWCSIEGGAEEFPCERRLVSVRRGDTVRVRIEDGVAAITGNVSDPSASGEDARKAQLVAQTAAEAASKAADGATIARQMAESATADAATAASAASSASSNAEIALAAAQEVNGLAQGAASDAAIARESATTAMYDLSVVEDVVGTLNWICEHGVFEATTDTSPQAGKRYFTRSGTSPNYSYAPVANPTGNPSTLGYYEFTGQLDATVQNYIASHIALTDDGLWVTKDGQGCHLLISNDRLSFVGVDGSEVAYIAVDGNNESTFYMTRSVVVKDLKFGKWMWFERSNRNMALKWVG